MGVLYVVTGDPVILVHRVVTPTGPQSDAASSASTRVKLPT